MTTKLKALPPMSDVDLAAAIKRALETVAKLVELARIRGIRVNFNVGPGSDGKTKVTQLEVTKTEKLLK